MRRALVERLLASILCTAACATGAAPLETLFHSPQERERLDRLRRGEAPAAAAGARDVPARQREVTGYVKRSDGRGTAFIDGVPVPVDARGAPLLEPGTVRGQSPPASENLRIERKPAR